jgi:hypothetical protein
VRIFCWSTMLLVSILVACGKPEPEGSKLASVCDTGKKHCITVYAVGGVLSVDNPYLDLRGKGPDHKIYWLFDDTTASGFIFPDDGITFPSASQSEIQCQREDSGKRFRCDDKNQTPGHDPCPAFNGACYKYTIKATPPTGTIAPLDPWVVND